MRQLRVGLLIAVAGAIVGFQGPVRMRGQELPLIGLSTPTHVGIVVPNMEEAIQHYVRVMGFTAPLKPPVASPRSMPNGQKTEIKYVPFRMPNFQIDLIEPVGKVGPYYDHLQRFGMSIHHIGFNVTGDVDAMRAALEQKGGIWVLGMKGNVYTYVDFQSILGTTVEMVNTPGGGANGPPPPTPAAGALLPPLGSLRVPHIGFAVTDTDAVARGFAHVFGIQPPRVVDYKDSQYPPDSAWNRDAYLRLTSWKQGDLGMELIASVGAPTPWSEYLKKAKGSLGHHIALDVGDRMDETIRDLQAKGGKWTNGKVGGNYAYLDFMDTLGLVFELNGTSKSGRAAK